MNFGPIKRVLLLGGGKLLRKIALWIKKENLSLIVVISDRHAKEEFEGKKLDEFLKENNIKFQISNELDDSFKQFVGDTSKTFCLSLGASWIFKKDIIKTFFNNYLFNSHGTRLPQNRGGGGFSWQIMMGCKFGFSTLHLLRGGVDTGEIVACEEFLYPNYCRKPIDYQTVQNVYSFKLIKNFINKILNSSIKLNILPQLEYLSSYWPRINSGINGWINWNLEDLEIEKFICAFDEPYLGASTFINNQTVFLKSISISGSDGRFHPFQKGIIYRKNKKWICVSLKSHTLIVEKVINKEGKNIIDNLKVGDRFGTPFKYLEKALDRPFYDSKGLKK